MESMNSASYPSSWWSATLMVYLSLFLSQLFTATGNVTSRNDSLYVENDTDPVNLTRRGMQFPDLDNIIQSVLNTDFSEFTAFPPSYLPTFSTLNQAQSLPPDPCCMPQCGLTIYQLAARRQSQIFETSNVDGDMDYNPHFGDPSIDYEDDNFRGGSTRIVGGKHIPITQAPWQVSFLRTRGYSREFRHFCGGSVIHPQWIVTAAHCFSWIKRNPANRHDLKTVRMLAGTSSVSKSGTFYSQPSPQQTFELDTLIKYPLYDRSSSKYDLALVRLTRPLDFYPSLLINSICLPIKEKPLAGQVVTVSGFGRTSESGKPAKNLQAVNVTVHSNSVCSHIYNSVFVPETMICAGGKDEDSCQGDSGGPMYQYDPELRRFVLLGVVSYGVGCAREQYPGIYTKISHYSEWIRKSIHVNGGRKKKDYSFFNTIPDDDYHDLQEPEYSKISPHNYRIYRR